MRFPGRRDSCREILRKARIPMLPEKYFSIQILSSIIFFFSGLSLILFLGPVSSFLLAIFLSFLCYYIFLSYPKLRASSMRAKIDSSLPHAVTYLYAMSKGGGSLTSILRSLSRETNIYSESAKEAGYIIRDMDYFGVDLLTALHRAREATPSEKFRDFLDGLISVINSGGSFSQYFSSKSEYYQRIGVEEQKVWLDSLAMLAEAYVTAFVAGPLFVIVLLLLLGFTGWSYFVAMEVIIYLAIPLSTFFFIILLGSIFPSEEAPVYTEEKELKKFESVPVEGEKIKKKKIKKRRKIRLGIFVEKPGLCLFFTLPVSFSYFFSQIYLQWKLVLFSLERYPYWAATVTPPPHALVIDDIVFFTLLIALLPYLILYELKRRKVRGMEAQIPEFLKRLSSVHEVGLTLPRAIGVVARSKLGVLSEEVKRAWRDIGWGTLARDALLRLQRRVRTSAISRTITLIVNASRASGNISDVLSIAAKDATMHESMRRERSASMLVYILIIYVAFGVFLAVIAILNHVFLPVVPVPGTEAQAALVGELVARGTGKEMYKMLFFHAVLLQGFFTGLIAGKMGEGSARAGLKHSILMISIAYFVFSFLK